MTDQDELQRLREENEQLRASLAGRTGGSADSKPAQEAAPAASAAKPGSGCGWYIGAIVGVVLIGSIVIALAGSPPATPTATSTAADAQSVATPASPPPPKTWNIHTWKDEMRGAENKTACLTSSNQVQLNWPYTAQHVGLCIRKSARFGQDVYISLQSTGQFICRSYDGCTVKVKIDDRPIATYSASEPSDNSSETIFLDNAARFIAAVRNARTITVEAEFYEAGVQQMRFETAEDLPWPL